MSNISAWPDLSQVLSIEIPLRLLVIHAGYFGNDEATTSTSYSKGWLKIGDLCYNDEDGFLFIVDRLKELIKYKVFQVQRISGPLF